ncbi:MAG: UMP kinase [Clostridia bacterium]|nr:UMP kinase [Clostridia bacterium]MBR7062635.1 UMP kinase [Clostridia bacterium]
MDNKPVYKRVLIKVSGEALAGKPEGGKGRGFGLSQDMLTDVAKHIALIHEMGVEVAIVVGGGNFWRGAQSKSMDRTRADHMGMLATVMNSLALADALEQQELDVRVQTAIEMRQIAEPYIRNRAIRHLEKGRVVIFGCGTGNPFFTTDTAAALRAVEIDADVILLAKNVDAVYDSDPAKNPDAKRFTELTHDEVLRRDLKVMDSTAASLCRDNGVKIHVFGISDPDNILRAVRGEAVGTLIS